MVVNKIPCPLKQRNLLLSGETKRHVEVHKACKRNPALVQYIYVKGGHKMAATRSQSDNETGQMNARRVR